MKDLRVIANRKKEDMIIVDNLIHSFATDLENGIPIKSYLSGREDYELKVIADRLEGLKSFMDSSEYLEASFSLERFYEKLRE